MIVLAIHTVVEMVSKKQKNKQVNQQAVNETIIHPAEFLLR